MKCILCECSNTKENPVTKAPDPFQEEINGDNIEVWECDKCRRDLADDI